MEKDLFENGPVDLTIVYNVENCSGDVRFKHITVSNNNEYLDELIECGVEHDWVLSVFRGHLEREDNWALLAIASGV